MIDALEAAEARAEALAQENARLREGLAECAELLNEMANPTATSASVSLQVLWARCVQAGSKARALLTKHKATNTEGE